MRWIGPGLLAWAAACAFDSSGTGGDAGSAAAGDASTAGPGSDTGPGMTSTTGGSSGGTTLDTTATGPDTSGTAATAPESSTTEPPGTSEGTTGILGGPNCGGKWWDAQMDADPTAQDLDGDGVNDWDLQGGDFPAGALMDGVWHVASNSTLRTQPDDAFAQRVVVALRMRNAQMGTRGATFGVNLGQDDDTVTPLWVSMRREADDTQVVTIGGRSDPDTNVPLLSVPGLPSEMIDVNLDVDVVAGEVAVVVDGVDQGVVMPPSFVDAPPARAIVGANSTPAEIDFVNVESCP